MTRSTGVRQRKRGSVDKLPSGALRVRVYAGVDPLSGKAHYLTDVVPPGPKAAAEAEKIRTRLLAQVDEQRNPRTKATVNQLLDRYLEVLDVEQTTRDGYERYMRIHIRPLLGDLPLSRIDGEVLDSFYARLRTCRSHCRGRRYVEHRTNGDHDCNDRCVPHRCKPLADASVRQIHNILKGAFGRAVRWRWLGVNPVDQAQAPSQPSPNPQPPTRTQAAQIAMEAWTEPEWGMFVWLAMTTGARRGELCALRWDRLDFASGVLTIGTSIAQVGPKVWEKETKTHQQRRIVLDPQTLALLRAYLHHCAERAAALDIELPADAFMFASQPDGRVGIRPDTVTQRFTRMCARLGWTMHLHQLRHYSATELIASGVDVRTVAGRLGHGGGGTTTLRVYSAWVAEADQRAAQALSAGMPELPALLAAPATALELPAAPATDSPYLHIATDLRAAIRCGALNAGDSFPTVKDLARRYNVSVSTAHRAISELTATGEATVSRGKRAIVAQPV